MITAETDGKNRHMEESQKRCTKIESRPLVSRDRLFDASCAEKKHAGVGVCSVCNLRIHESGTSLSGFIHFSSTGSFNGMFSF